MNTRNIVTKENMFRLAAELQWEVEAEIGRSLPKGAIYPVMHESGPTIGIHAEKCGEEAMGVIMRRCESE